MGSSPNFLSIASDSVTFLNDGGEVATWKYWTQNWYPAHYLEIGPSLGTYLSTSKQVIESLGEEKTKSLYLLGKLTFFDKRKYVPNNLAKEMYAIRKLFS
jgi:hypothetical protein